MEVGLLMLGAGVAAGAFGALLGLGGGILIVPVLTIGFGVPVREAVGVSLVSVIVTSAASASLYLERDQADLPLAMSLELFTASGAVIGGVVAFLLDERFLAGLFAAMLVYVAITMLRGAVRLPGRRGLPTEEGPVGVDEAAAADEVPPGGEKADDSAGSADQVELDASGAPTYRSRHFPLAAGASVGAGIVSALLGIGGGIIKVPLMHLIMGVPLRIATATSNLMIGITGSTSALVYLLHGGIDGYAAGPIALGVFVGARIGSRVSHRIDVRILRLLFVVVLLYTAVEMARRALAL
jgi:uncharacterized protein